MADSLLALDEVKRLYRTRHGAVRAVDGVSLEVFAGESVGLVGESGSGKTTLGRLAVRLESATSGRVSYAGADITTLRGERLRRMRTEFQMIFQDPATSLNPRMRVGELIGEPITELKTLPAALVDARVREIAELVGIDPSLLDRYPRQLSGGQAQRVSIGRALAVDPRLVVADEPVSALDAAVSAQIVDLLDRLKVSLGISFLFVSHDLSVVRHLCDRVAVMYLGRIVEIGPTEDVFTRPQHPYTAALLSATPDGTRAVDGSSRRIVLSGDLPDPSDVPPGCRFHSRCPIGPISRAGRSKCVTVDPVLTPTVVDTQAACHFQEDVDSLVDPASRLSSTREEHHGNN